MNRYLLLLIGTLLSGCAAIQNPREPFVRADSGLPHAVIADSRGKGGRFDVWVSAVDEQPSFLEGNRGVYHRADVAVAPGRRTLAVHCSDTELSAKKRWYNNIGLIIEAKAGETYTITCAPERSEVPGRLIAQYQIRDKSGQLVPFEPGSYLVRQP